MKNSTSIAAVVWLIVIGSSIVQTLVIPGERMAPFQWTPWPFVLFLPLVVVLGAFSAPSYPENSTIGKIIDQRYGEGSYVDFINRLKPELLLSAMCLSIAVCGLARRYLSAQPAQPLVIDGFFASGCVAFCAAYFIRRRRENAAKNRRHPTQSTSSTEEMSAFWREARRRRNLCLIVGPSWLLVGPLLFGLYSMILPRTSVQFIMVGALLTWGAVMMWAQTRLRQIECYNCGRQIFGRWVYSWSLKCRNCGASPEDHGGVTGNAHAPHLLRDR